MPLPPLPLVKLDIKMSEETTDKFVNAALDVISPIRHGIGLIGDQIQFYRLYRKEALAKIYSRAEPRITKIEKRADLSPKFGLPYLEKASAEDIDSELVDWWANLLVSALANKDHQRPLFVDFISKMTSAEANFLEKFWSTIGGDKSATDNHFEFISKFVQSRHLAAVTSNEFTSEIYESSVRVICQELFEHSPQNGILLAGGRYVTNGEKSGIPSHLGKPWDKTAIETCIILGLLKRETVGFEILGPYITTHYFDCDIVCFTQIGADFMTACHE